MAGETNPQIERHILIHAGLQWCGGRRTLILTVKKVRNGEVPETRANIRRLSSTVWPDVAEPSIKKIVNSKKSWDSPRANVASSGVCHIPVFSASVQG